jgi:hypothetical protein
VRTCAREAAQGQDRIRVRTTRLPDPEPSAAAESLREPLHGGGFGTFLAGCHLAFSSVA